MWVDFKIVPTDQNGTDVVVEGQAGRDLAKIGFYRSDNHVTAYGGSGYAPKLVGFI